MFSILLLLSFCFCYCYCCCYDYCICNGDQADHAWAVRQCSILWSHSHLFGFCIRSPTITPTCWLQLCWVCKFLSTAVAAAVAATSYVARLAVLRTKYSLSQLHSAISWHWYTCFILLKLNRSYSMHLAPTQLHVVCRPISFVLCNAVALSWSTQQAVTHCGKSYIGKNLALVHTLLYTLHTHCGRSSLPINGTQGNRFLLFWSAVSCSCQAL